MKKILYILGFLMFSSLVFNPMISRTALGDSGSSGSSSGSSGCSYPWITCGLQANLPDTDWSATFGTTDPTKAGQDLYMHVLAKVSVSPDQQAFKTTSQAFGASQSDINRILNNDFGPILDKSPYITQQQAINKMLEIQKKYQDEKDIFVLQSDLDAAVTPSEIFADGDTSDSGFDLIVDLNNIQNILFKKMDPIDVGGNFNNGSGGSAPSGSSPGGLQGSTGPSGAQQPGQAPAGSGGPATGTTSSPLTATGSPISTQESGLNPAPAPSSNPNICFANQTLNKALQDFGNKVVTDPRYKQTPTVSPPAPPPAPSGQTQQNGGGNNGGNGNPNGGVPVPPFTDISQPATNVQPAPAANWLSTPPCNQVLCIQVNFVKTIASAYTNSDNCIACHVEKIDAQLKTTIDHSLIPGKATGNLLEPGICKRATADLFAAANMHMYFIAKPVLTPKNDDLIYGTSMVDSWNKFLQNYKPFPFYSMNVPDPKDPTQDPFVPTVEDTATKQTLMYINDDTPISQVSANLQQQIQATYAAIATSAATADASVQSSDTSSYYNDIRKELDKMNNYFQNFQDVLHSINSQVGSIQEDHPCDTLLNSTPECS